MKQQFWNTNSKRKVLFISAVLACLAIGVGAWLLNSGGEAGSGSTVPDAGLRISAEDRTRLESLVGEWKRQDGDYVVQIRKIKADGGLDAAYFNPKPINVARAESLQKDGKMKIFIELRDQGYPGSAYTLDFDPERDILKGLYFHAVLKKYFKVFFIRKK